MARIAKLGLGLCLGIGLLLAMAYPVMADPVPVPQLVEQGQIWDGHTVELTGEAIGDLMIRGENGWLNVLDRGTVLGVWGAREQLAAVQYLGDYDNMGDTVYVRGTFNLACKEHGGDMDIHIQDLKVIKRGGPVVHPVNPWRLGFAVAAGVSAVIMGVLLRDLNLRRETTGLP